MASEGYRGTFQPSRKPVISTAPDAVVLLNGQVALPSGANPRRTININPYVTNVSTSLAVESAPGSANISLHIPKHAIDDFFRAGNLILTTMMEVKIYIKGNFLVGGGTRYYPAFWGVVTSVSHQWSGGEQTVDLSCQDILYWWTIQRININPSYLGAKSATQGSFNVKGSGVFTGSNPFDTIYSLARYAYGDAVNANIFLRGQQQVTEPNAAENQRLMAYWTRQWGRIAYSLKMYGPDASVIQGDVLSTLLSTSNRQAAFSGRSGSSARNRARISKAFKQGDINVAEVSAFSEILSRIGSFDIYTSEFQTKKEIADTTKTSIGYELFMDTTTEIVFKPPFYNLDVIPNKPVSWIRPIDVISESYSENPPDITFLEGTSNLVRNMQVGEPELGKPKATYVDYRLVAKYGWKPGTYNSEFFGAGLGADASRNLFYHLVDELDRQNARVKTGSITIPIRPELRLGYPIYLQHTDTYWYVEGISHNFSFQGNCTTTLTLMAPRSKFYADFPYWKDTVGAEPKGPDWSGKAQAPVGEVAQAELSAESTLYKRPLDPLSGNPVGDRNVLFVPQTPGPQDEADARNGFAPQGPSNATMEGSHSETKAEAVYRDLVSYRTQFRIYGDFNYVYQVDPSRDSKDPNATIQTLTISAPLKPDGTKARQKVATFPVSDERGYEVLGAYRYGRGVKLSRSGLDFTRQTDIKAKALLSLRPSQQQDLDIEQDIAEGSMNQPQDPTRDRSLMIDPNNYGRRLSDITPAPTSAGSGYVGSLRGVTRSVAKEVYQPTNPSGSYAGVPDIDPSRERSFRATDKVLRWLDLIDEVRVSEGVTPTQYPDTVILGFIHTESGGNTKARGKTKSGKLKQFTGLLQIGHANAADDGKTNLYFQGKTDSDEEAARRSITHLIRYMEKRTSAHKYDPDRMAMVWKAGAGSTRTFNRMQAQGATDKELAAYLKTRWGADSYIYEHRQARGVWERELAASGSGGGQQVQEGLEEPLDDPSFSEALASISGRPSSEDDLALEASTSYFKKILDARNESTLPSLFKPVRDPSLVEVLNDFLRRVYENQHKAAVATKRQLDGSQQGQGRQGRQGRQGGTAGSDNGGTSNG